MQEGEPVGSQGWDSSLGSRLALCCLLAPSALGATKPKKVKDTTTWLCKPGIPDNPCAPGFDTTMISPSGQIVGTAKPKSDPNRKKIDCFYVYPTVSDDKSVNSDLSIDPEERSIALSQAARYGLHCRVFAPMYRQVTVQTLLSGGSIPPDACRRRTGMSLQRGRPTCASTTRAAASSSSATPRAPSCCASSSTRLIDPKKKVRKLLVSAILLGGNVTVATGQQVGGDFKKIPGAEGQAVRLRDRLLDLRWTGTERLTVRAPGLRGLTPPGLPTTGDVLCTNPAALAGGSALLTSVFPSAPFAPGTTIGTATEAIGMNAPAGVDNAVVRGPGVHRRMRLRQQRTRPADQPRRWSADPARGPRP